MQMEWNRIKRREVFFSQVLLFSAASRLSSGIWYEKDIIFHRPMRKKIENPAEYIDWSIEIYMQEKLLVTQNQIFINQEDEAREWSRTDMPDDAQLCTTSRQSLRKSSQFLLASLCAPLLDFRSIHGQFHEAVVMSYTESRDMDWRSARKRRSRMLTQSANQQARLRVAGCSAHPESGITIWKDQEICFKPIHR